MATIAPQAASGTAPAQAPAQTVLELNNVSKIFGAVKAVDGVSLDLRKGEVLTLLGPSGCGKTTTLRLVIGLERSDSGTIVFNGRTVDEPGTGAYVPTHKREMGMVFQSYAIWPHMTVFENVAYPLRVRRWKNDRVREAVERSLALVDLAGLGQRPATMLSGGQQQRVAVARALVFEPELLLLDEPFSNLDAKLREQTRAELKVLQRRLGITVLLVTHDQIEALSLSDRIAVMSQGRVEQLGTPQELYRAPASAHVRDFLGRTIVFAGEVAERAPSGGGTVIALQGGARIASSIAATEGLTVGQRCHVAVRPEQVEVHPADSTRAPAAGTANTLQGKIEALLFIGDRYEARIMLPWGESILVYLPATDQWAEGMAVTLMVPAHEVRLWPA